MIKISASPDHIANLGFNPHLPATLAPCDTHLIETECDVLKTIGTKSIVDKVLNPEIVAHSPKTKWINLLQIDSLIPPFLAILLKHCEKDCDTFKRISHTILEDQLNQGVIPRKAYQFLVNTLNQNKFENVYKYLYAAAIHHKMNHGSVIQDVVTELNEKWFFQIDGALDEMRKKYVKSEIASWLDDVKKQHPEVGGRVDKASRALKDLDDRAFSAALKAMLEPLKSPPDGNRVKGLYYKELLESMNRYSGENSMLLLHELLKAQDFYETWDCNVGGICKQLEEAIAEDHAVDRRDSLIASCTKVYNVAALLLADHKNLRCASETAYAEAYGRLRHRFRVIDFDVRKHLGVEHIFCNCHYQSQQGENCTLNWPVVSEKVVNLTPCPVTAIDKDEKKMPPSALIATQSFGFGNRRIAGTVGAYYGRAGFDVNIVDIPSGVLKEHDLIYRMTSYWPFSAIFGKGCTKVDLYHWLVKNNYWGIIRLLRKLTAGGDASKETVQPVAVREGEKDLMRRNFLMHRPDILISTAVMHERHLLELAEELNMPMLQVSADLDYRRIGWQTPPEYPKYRFAAAVQYPGVEENIAGTLKPEQVDFIGSGIVDPALIPNRSPEEIAQLKVRMGIDPKKKVVLVMNGGCGCYSPYPEALAKRFKEDEGDIHLIVVCGQNESFRSYLINKVLPLTKMTMDVRGFVFSREEMNDILDVIDVGVTKPGGGSTMELGHKGKFILFDDTLNTDLSWEGVNKGVVCSFGMGDTLKRADEFYSKLRALFDAKPPEVNPFAEKDPEQEIVEITRKMLKDE